MNTFSILLVEDDSIERLKFQKVVKNLKGNFAISEAVNGKCALELLDTQKTDYHLIISDFNMPIMNGFEFLIEVKSRNEFKNIPFVIMSNTNDLDELKKCFELGISGYFKKPYNFNDFSKKVKTVLEYWNNNDIIKA
ncbi:MAG: response regulator [Flavobacteriia bacterium]|nr:response regulator [Flavobacteriia bacterium]OIP47748.1 MAG: hypothetical protein AUK46_04395 [Flavobacteriaceae bacterium CG2_30_31_66]PIV97438.1 MAG: response regulator [Flavobacteriaceae bacterium CG17_big_fil_post_rev_8_21_14_2_50_31_13]PIX11763.1 MAG: response regulator [Flavobacteriaceae bacterium CG_4_8_14_3_um_filter_31_8]PIY14797.1 MAG: response regulator [Flavobacteriaceae bacterium CG_4_10_14_3_um_filter_31_253]PIZ12145.1 MAG: response regulator [Flavobacteriaceae bacterium CG_4_